MALPRHEVWRSAELLDRGRQGHSHRLEDLAANSLAFAADRKAYAIFFDLDLLERFEILTDIGPFKVMIIGHQALIEFFSQHRY